MKILLNGTSMTDRSTLHDQLAKQFQFPDYYGRNLDALYDLLTALPEPVDLTVVNPDQIPENLGKYGKSFLKTLEDASKVNKKLNLLISFEKSENNS